MVVCEELLLPDGAVTAGSGAPTYPLLDLDAEREKEVGEPGRPGTKPRSRG